MLPVVAGVAATKRQILIYSVVLALAGGAAVAARLRRHRPTASLRRSLGVVFVGLALERRRMRAERRRRWRRRGGLFAFSILYLFLLFAVLLAEAGLGVAGLAA